MAAPKGSIASYMAGLEAKRQELLGRARLMGGNREEVVPESEVVSDEGHLSELFPGLRGDGEADIGELFPGAGSEKAEVWVPRGPVVGEFMGGEVRDVAKPYWSWSPVEEGGFRTGIAQLPWYKEFIDEYGVPPNLDGGDYDYRGAWEAGIRPERYGPDGGKYRWPSKNQYGQWLTSPEHRTAWMEDYGRITGGDAVVDGVSQEEWEATPEGAAAKVERLKEVDAWKKRVSEYKDAAGRYVAEVVFEPTPEQERRLSDRPDLAGLVEDGRVILNPFNGKARDPSLGYLAAMGLTAQAFMEKNPPPKGLSLTEEQRGLFEGKPGTEQDHLREVLAGVFSGDLSVGHASAEQLDYVDKVLNTQIAPPEFRKPELSKQEPTYTMFGAWGGNLTNRMQPFGNPMDIARSLGISVGSNAELAGTVQGLISGDMDNVMREGGQKVVEYLRAHQSGELKHLENRRMVKVEEAQGLAGKAAVFLWETATSAPLFANFMAEQAVQVLISGGIAAGAKAGANLILQKMGEGTVRAGSALASKIGVTVGAQANAVLTAGDAASQAYRDMMALPDSVWEAHPGMDALLAKRMSFENAKKALALRGSRDAAGAAYVASYLLSKIPGARAIEETAAGIPGRAGRLANAAVGVLGTGTSQAIEEGMTTFSANVATKVIDPEKDIWQGVGEDAGAGALFGVFGVMSYANATIDDVRAQLRMDLLSLPDEVWKQLPEYKGDGSPLANRLEKSKIAKEMASEGSFGETALQLMSDKLGGRIDPWGTFESEGEAKWTPERKMVRNDLLRIDPKRWESVPEVAALVDGGANLHMAILSVATKMAGEANLSRTSDVATAANIFRKALKGTTAEPTAAADIQGDIDESRRVRAAGSVDEAISAADKAVEGGATELEERWGVPIRDFRRTQESDSGVTQSKITFEAMRAAGQAARDVVRGNWPGVVESFKRLGERWGQGAVEKARDDLRRRLDENPGGELKDVPAAPKGGAEEGIRLANIDISRLRLGARPERITQERANLSPEQRSAYDKRMTELVAMEAAEKGGVDRDLGEGQPSINITEILTPGSNIVDMKRLEPTPTAPAPSEANEIRDQDGNLIPPYLYPLYDEQGRYRFFTSKDVQKFGKDNNLGPDAIRILVKSVSDGQPISIDEARARGEEESKKRRERFEESQTPEAKAKRDADEAAKLKSAQEERDRIVSESGEIPDGNYRYVNPKDGTLEDDPDDIEYVVKNGVVYRVDRDNTLDPQGRLKPGEADDKGVVFAASIKNGTIRRSKPTSATAPAPEAPPPQAEPPAAAAPGSELENGFRAGPEPGSKYRVSRSNSGIMLERRYPSGTVGSFWVGSNGNLVDADNIVWNDAESVKKIWQPTDPAKLDAVEELLWQRGPLNEMIPEQNAARKDLLAKIKAIVLGEEKPGSPPAPEAPATGFEATRARLEEMLSQKSQAELEQILRGSGLRVGKNDTPEVLIERAIAAREAAETLRQYPTVDDAANAVREGKITKEQVLNWWEAVRRATNSPNDTINFELNLQGIYGWAARSGAFSTPINRPSGPPPTPPAETPAPPTISELTGSEEDSLAVLGGQAKTDALREAYLGEMIASASKFSKVTAQSLGVTELTPAQYKAAQEVFETVQLERASDLVSSAADSVDAKFASVLSLMQSQPALAARSSETMARQAYSTPLPLAYLSAELTKMDDTKTVYEPTAGNGALLLLANPENTVANELDPLRRVNLVSQGFKPSAYDAIKTLPEPKSADIVVANPPFGALKSELGLGDTAIIDGYRLTKVDHVIAARALTAMKDNGRAVLILGADGLAKSEHGLASKVFLNWLAAHYNVVGHFEVAGKLYSKQGASWPVRVIVVNGRRAVPDLKQVAPDIQTIKRVSTWEDVYGEFKKIVGTDEWQRSAEAPAGIPGPAAGKQVRAGNETGGETGGTDQQGGQGGTRQPRKRKSGTAGRAPVRGRAGGESAGGGVRGPADTRPPAPVEQPSAQPGGDQGAEPAGGGRPAGMGGVDAGGQPVANQPGNWGESAEEKKRRIRELMRKEEEGEGGEVLFALEEDNLGTPAPAGARPFRFNKEVFNLGVELAIDAFKSGARKFSQFARQIISDGLMSWKKLQKYLPAWYNVAKANLEAQGESTEGLDSADSVDAMMDMLIEMAPGNEAPVIPDETPAPQPTEQTAEQPVEAEAAPVEPVEPESEENPNQVEYIPKSTGVDEMALIPENLSAPTSRWLDRLENEVGDLIEYVADRLGYDPELLRSENSPLMGLQIDAIASSIYQVEKGRGIIIADQTGIGKGREAAAMMRYALRHGMTPIFFTEKVNLFSDMWNDMHEILVDEVDIRPFVMNTSAKITPYGPKGKSVMHGREMIGGRSVVSDTVHRQKIRNLAADKEAPALPDNANMLWTTYSQFDRDDGIQRDAISRFLAHPGVKPLFVMDEAHNMAGEQSEIVKDRKTGKYKVRMKRAGLVTGMVVDHPVVYLSATYAKRTDNMVAYHRTDMIDAVGGDRNKLGAAIELGGVPLQSVTAAKLAESGQLMRRERSFKGIDIPIVTIPDENGEQREQMDAVTEVFRAVIPLSRQFMDKVKDRWARENGYLRADDAGNMLHKMYVNPFTNVVHNNVRQVMLGISADVIATEAIEALSNKENPQKVIVASEQNLAKFLEDWVEETGTQEGELVTVSYRDVIRKSIDRTRRIKVTDNQGNEVANHIVTMEELAAIDYDLSVLYAGAYAMVDKLDVERLPVSPLDWVAYRVREAGYTMGEITGRTYWLEYTGTQDENGMYQALLRKRTAGEKSDNRAIIDRFNGRGTTYDVGGNEKPLDSLVINQSGATGISLHAAPIDKSPDQRQRYMIMAELPGDVNIMVQMFGRINRTKQTKLPRYMINALDLPSSRRPIAMASRKLKKLNANTTADDTSATSIKGVDLFDKYGDLVTTQFLLDNRQFQHASGVTVDPPEFGKPPKVQPDIAKDFFGKMAVLPVEWQNAAFDTIERNYKELIDYLNAIGENDLSAKTLDMRAGIIESVIMSKGDRPESQFGGDATLHKVEADAEGSFLSAQDVRDKLAATLAGRSPNKHLTDLYERLAPGIAAYRKTHFEDTPPKEPKNGEVRDDVKFDQGIEELDSKLYQLRVGTRHHIWLHDRDVAAVVVDIKPDEAISSGFANPTAQSRWSVKFATNAPAQDIWIPLSRLQKPTNAEDKTAMWRETTPDMTDGWLDRAFPDSRASGTEKITERRYIITGELLGAFAKMSTRAAGFGRVVFFTDAAGQKHQGILLPRTTTSEILRDMDASGKMNEGDPAKILAVLDNDKFPGNEFTPVNSPMFVRMASADGGFRILTQPVNNKYDVAKTAKAVVTNKELAALADDGAFHQNNRSQMWSASFTKSREKQEKAVEILVQLLGKFRNVIPLKEEQFELLGLGKFTAKPSFDGVNNAPVREGIVGEDQEPPSLVDGLFPSTTKMDPAKEEQWKKLTPKAAPTTTDPSPGPGVKPEKKDPLARWTHNSEEYVAVKGNVGRDLYDRISRLASQHGGKWTPSSRSGNLRGGFRFGSKAQADKFATQVLDVIGVSFSLSEHVMGEPGWEGKGLPKGTVLKAIARVANAIHASTGIKVEVIYDSDIPQTVRDRIPAGSRPSAYFSHASNTIYLISDNLRSERHAQAMLAHELVGHAGMEAVVRDWGKVESLLNSLLKQNGKRVRKLWSEVQRRYPEAVKNGDFTRLTKEFIALAAEQRDQAGPLSRFLSMVKEMLVEALKALGFRLPLGMSEINALLTASELYIRRGGNETETVIDGMALEGYSFAQDTSSRPAGTMMENYEAVAPEVKRQIYKNHYDTMVKNEAVSRVKSPVTKILDRRDLAAVAASFSRGAQESVYAIITADNGRILEVQRHGLGNRNKTDYVPETMVGAVLDVPGAAGVSFVHNHPGTTVPGLSESDRKVAEHLYGMFKNTSVAMRHFAAITTPDKNGNHVFSVDTQAKDGTRAETSFRFKSDSAAQSFSIPVTERTIERWNEDPIFIESSNDAISLLAEMAEKDGGPFSGLIMLNGDNAIVGMLPMSGQEMRQVRIHHGEDPVTPKENILVAMHQSNADRVIIVGELPKEGNPYNSYQEDVKNMARFLRQSFYTARDGVFLRSSEVSDETRLGLMDIIVPQDAKASTAADWFSAFDNNKKPPHGKVYFSQEPLPERSAVEAFEPETIREWAVTKHKARRRLIEMNIDDFLNLAAYGFGERKQTDADRIVQSGEKLQKIFGLSTRQDKDGNLKVTSHEGRHRARALKKVGYTSIPVLIEDRNLRWSEQIDESLFGYEENWPQKIIEQDPESHGRSEDNPFSIPMPITQEQAALDYNYTQKPENNPAEADEPTQDDDVIDFAWLDPKTTPSSFLAAAKAFGYRAREEARWKNLKYRYAVWIKHPLLQFRQWAVDAYASFDKILGTPEGYMSAHLTKSAAGAIEAAVEYGGIYLDPDGVIQVDFNKPSLRSILEPLGVELDRFLYWYAAHRADILMAQGRENNLTQQEIDDLLAGDEDGIPGTANYLKGRKALYAETAKLFQEFHNDIVQIAVDTGLVNDQEAALWKREFYLPFYRVLEEKDQKNPQGYSGMSGNASLVRQIAYRRLWGAKLKADDLMTNAMSNWYHLLTASLRNKAAKLALVEAVGLGIATPANANTPDAIWVKVNGKKDYYTLEDTPEGRLVMASLLAFHKNDMVGPGWTILKKAKQWFTAGVTANPAFKLANLFRDSITALAILDISANPFKNVKEGWKATSSSDQMYAQMLASGAIFAESGYIHGGDADQVRWLIHRGLLRGTTVDTRLMLTRGWQFYQDFGTRLENLNRAARYVQGQQRGETKLESAFASRDLLDFTRTGAGWAPRLLASTVAFINARAQGLDKLRRAGISPQQRARFGKVVTTYIAADIVVYLLGYLYGGDDWDETEEWARDTYHLVPTPWGTGYIPRAFELGAAGVVAERVLDMFIASSMAPDWAQDTKYGESVKRNANSELFAKRMLFVLTQTFGMNPIPQAGAPLVDLWRDKDSFTGRPIEGSLGPNTYDEGLSPENRFRSYTTSTARFTSEVMAGATDGELTISPVRLDALIEGYGGWLAGFVTKNVLDHFVDPMLPDTGERPDKEISESEFLFGGRFFKTGQPKSTKYLTAFYEIDRELGRVMRDARFYNDRGQVIPEMAAEAAAHEEEYELEMAYKRFFSRTRRDLNELNKEEQLASINPSLSGAEKKAEIDRLNKEQQELAKYIVVDFQEAKAKQREGR